MSDIKTGSRVIITNNYEQPLDEQVFGNFVGKFGTVMGSAGAGWKVVKVDDTYNPCDRPRGAWGIETHLLRLVDDPT